MKHKLSDKKLKKNLQNKMIVISSAIILATAISIILMIISNVPTLNNFVGSSADFSFNAAVYMLLFSVALYATAINKNNIAQSICMFIILANIIAIFQYIYSIDLGVDQLLFNSRYDSSTKFPGRQTISVAVLFCILSSALISLSINKAFTLRIIFGGILSGTSFCTSLILFIGYINSYDYINASSGVVEIYQPTTAAVACLMMSISLIILYVDKISLLKIRTIKYVPYIIGTSLLIATALLSYTLRVQEHINHHTTLLPLTLAIIGSILAISATLTLMLAINVSFLLAENRKLLAKSHATLEASTDGMLVVSNGRHITDFNQRFLQLWGIPGESFLLHFTRHSLADLLAKQLKNSVAFYTFLKHTEGNEDIGQVETLHLISGNVYEMRVKPQVVFDKTIGTVWSYRDITKEMSLQEELVHQTTYDLLTTLPNRTLLTELAKRSIEKSQENNTQTAIILIDIDRMSEINDQFGRTKLDFVIKQVATRLKDELHERCILGRLSSNAFLIIAEDLANATASIIIVDDIIRVFKKPFVIYGHDVEISCGIGISFYPTDALDIESLISNAEIAMIRAKKTGRGEFQYYSTNMNEYTVQRMDFESELHKAIQNNQLVVYYQPIVNLIDLKIIGAEALVRWNHPTRGILPPIEFIPIAEEIGIIGKLGAIVLHTACMQAKAWADTISTDFIIAVNCSVKQINQENYPSEILDVLSGIELPATNLELEITEGILMSRNQTFDKVLSEVHGMGISIAIDDFGTGFSSFSYLRRFPLNKLKIDRSFITDFKVVEDKAVVKAMVMMGKCLHMTMLAEGIETKEQLTYLQEINCDQGQGFYFSKPIPADQFTELLKTGLQLPE